MSDPVPSAAVRLACHANVFVAEPSAENLRQPLERMAELGYSHIALPPLDASRTDVDALRHALAERGISPITTAGGLTAESDVGSPDPQVRAAGVAILRSVVDLTEALGGRQMNGVPYGLFGHPTGATTTDAFARSAREVGAVADYAHDRGITMTFEVLNRYETSAINTAAQAVEFVAASGSDHLRIHLDTFHMAVEEADMVAAVELALPSLGYLELGQSGRGPLSTGVVDIVGVVRHAVAAGYTGVVGVEAFARSILPPPVDDMLAIWRDPFSDGLELAADAARVIRLGLSRP